MTTRKPKKTGNNCLSFVIGSVLGAIAGFVYGVYVWLPNASKCDTEECSVIVRGFFLMIIAPVLWGFIGVLLGGVAGIGVYNLVRFVRNKKTAA